MYVCIYMCVLSAGYHFYTRTLHMQSNYTALLCKVLLFVVIKPEREREERRGAFYLLVTVVVEAAMARR